MIQYEENFTTVSSGEDIDKIEIQNFTFVFVNPILSGLTESGFVFSSTFDLKNESGFNYSYISRSIKRTIFSFSDQYILPYALIIDKNIDSYFLPESILLPATSAGDKNYLSLSAEITRKVLENSDIDNSLDILMEEFSNVLVSKQYRVCDEILNEIDINNLKPDHLIGILTITFSFKELLELRDAFYYQVYSKLFDDLGYQKTTDLLNGLA